MKILDARQIHVWDAYTMEHEPIASIDLMERAAAACTDRLLQLFQGKERFYVFCGKGNNGGDGLAIARQLHLAGKTVEVWTLFPGKAGSADFETNKTRALSAGIVLHDIVDAAQLPAMSAGDVAIDALFGSGLNQPLHGIVSAVVLFLNSSRAGAKIAIDVPSGMYLDHSSIGNMVFQAGVTFTFQVLKLCFLLPENAPFFGKIEVLDIGLDPLFPDTAESSLHLVDLGFARTLYRPRSEYGNKGTFGHALLIAGNRGKMGAAVMAATACLRSGAGLLTCSVPASEAMILPIALPEAMSTYRDAPVVWEKYHSIGVGPGLGTEETALLLSVLQQAKVPLVLDADALNMLAENQEWLDLVPPCSILSPHPKEFSRLFGQLENDEARIRKALDITTQYPFVVILKGHNTLVSYQGKGYFNTTGNAGMATGGSGDTLTGILTSLLAQGYAGRDAAILGVYLHGLAGDLALDTESEESLLPMDISRYLGRAYRQIR